MIEDLGQGKWRWLGLKTNLIGTLRIWWYKREIRRLGNKKFLEKYR